jgi:putative DNA primase/helicase
VKSDNVVTFDVVRRSTDYHHTDYGNAERLVARHGQDLRYCGPFGSWLVWDERRWQRDETGEVVRRAKETLRALLADTAEIDDDDTRRQLTKHALASERESRIASAIALAKSEPTIPVLPEQLDADPWAFNVLNGTIDLRTGELRPHRRADIITRLSPVEYDPNARCPRFERFLDEILMEDDLVTFVQRYAGYSLTGSTREQVFVQLYGGGANGKSTLLETLRAVLGDYGQQAPAETFLERRDSIPNDVARLRGARFVAATETGEGRRLNEVLVKRLTGGDTIAARFMRGEWFEFTPTFKTWLASNHKPEIRGTDEAIWRRIRQIPFTVTIPPDQRDPRLRDALAAELPGILAWAVQGCLDWQHHGLGTSVAVDQATAEYRDEMDVLGGFIADTCIVLPDVSAKAGALYHAYTEWADDNGVRDRLSQQAFGRRLRDRGFEQERTDAARWWRGIGLRGTRDDG